MDPCAFGHALTSVDGHAYTYPNTHSDRNTYPAPNEHAPASADIYSSHPVN